MDKKISKILKDREIKQLQINKLFAKGNYFVISISLNIPGVQKTNKLFNKFFNKISKLIYLKIKKQVIVIKKFKYKKSCGNYIFIVIKQSDNYFFIKNKLLEIENELGYISNLVDIDLYIEEEKTISRNELGIKNRKCFICNCDAKECSRSQSHDYVELIDYVNNLINNYLRKEK